MEHEKGPEIAYFLAKNPGKLEEVMTMPIVQRMSEIARIGAEFTPKTSTGAPPPTEPVSGGGENTGEKQLHEMTQAELAAYQRKKKGWA